MSQNGRPDAADNAGDANPAKQHRAVPSQGLLRQHKLHLIKLSRITLPSPKPLCGAAERRHQGRDGSRHRRQARGEGDVLRRALAQKHRRDQAVNVARRSGYRRWRSPDGGCHPEWVCRKRPARHTEQ